MRDLVKGAKRMLPNVINNFNNIIIQNPHKVEVNTFVSRTSTGTGIGNKKGKPRKVLC